MITTWILAAMLAEGAEGQSTKEAESNRIVVPVPTGTMTCTKEGDHLVCILPLQKEVADEPLLSSSPTPKAQPYKRSPPMPALPDPQIVNQLKVAEANIELAKSLLPRATSPEEAVLAEQLLYWAKEHYKWTEALLHHESDAQTNPHKPAPIPAITAPGAEPRVMEDFARRRSLLSVEANVVNPHVEVVSQRQEGN